EAPPVIVYTRSSFDNEKNREVRCRRRHAVPNRTGGAPSVRGSAEGTHGRPGTKRLTEEAWKRAAGGGNRVDLFLALRLWKHPAPGRVFLVTPSGRCRGPRSPRTRRSTRRTRRP